MDKTLKILNDLIETSKDGEYGFRSCAEHVRDNSPLRELFGNRANECRSAAAELQTLVVRLGGRPSDEGSVLGSLHRGWVSVRGALAGHSEQAMLEECERGEDQALDAYREALDEPELPPDVREVLERQYQGVKRNHAQIRNLRDQSRAQQA
ncbi:PA2169 family four-helix-bundle protein [Roseateles violae]|uniref:PA2169 family four-helix-bundle protein n=1 Tax=Roseateles violae TaxID=3058042 RepID=A0ABT8E0I4_9BURK|nr:PA2169 family four-helix-bundle protein [Pelomonas sp. PFR6]MDN3923308.1 PA2169 family four-helix-bundle protein [Pelomonas sp. PFR6]